MIKYIDYKVRELGAVVAGKFVPYNENIINVLAQNAMDLECENCYPGCGGECEKEAGKLKLIHG